MCLVEKLTATRHTLESHLSRTEGALGEVLSWSIAPKGVIVWLWQGANAVPYWVTELKLIGQPGGVP